MSWNFFKDVTREEIVEALQLFSPGRVLKQILRPGALWMVKDEGEGPYIVAYLIQRDRFRNWGYQELREARGTPANCPLELLALAPTVLCLSWREAVHRFHEDHCKHPAIGEIWSLKHSRVPHIKIVQIEPSLKGLYLKGMVRVANSQLVRCLRRAN
jgi:hypothetical protein